MKKICVITGTRADYGLLYWIMKGIQKSNDLELQVIATCMHLSEKFGSTWEKIEEDSFPLSKKVDLGKLGDSRQSLILQLSKGIEGFFSAFGDLDPDLILILGDRYEMLAAAQAGVFSRIPIAHIHGGEITEGAFDDTIRHVITKMSSYHFTSTEEHSKRVIQMGEDPTNVMKIGAPGLENIRKTELYSKEELAKKLGFELSDKNLLITYHPVTATNEDATDNLINALKQFPDHGQIITLPNSDPGHDSIFKALQKYADGRENVYLTTNLGFHHYLSAMKICDVVVGNSSSGIIEAPFMGTMTVNIGGRQKGRLQANSIINSDTGRKSIISAITESLTLNPKISVQYGDGFSAGKLVDFLEKTKFDMKSGFYDIPSEK